LRPLVHASRNSGGDSNDAASDWPHSGLLLVGDSSLSGMSAGRRLILIGVLLNTCRCTSAMVLTRSRSGLQWLRDFLCEPIRWRPVFDYLIGCELALGALVDHPASAGQANSPDFVGVTRQGAADAAGA